MKVEAWVSSQPGFYSRMLVGSIVVDDQMQIEPVGCLRVDLVEETDELLMPMTRHTITDDFAIEHTQAANKVVVPLRYVVRHGPTSALLQWKTGLSAIESLNLTFLVDTQHQGLVGWIEVKADDIIELLDEMLVTAKLESLGQMRFQPVSIPNALHSHPADTLSLGHGAHAPMSRISRCRMQRGLYDGSDLFFGETRDTTGPWCILAQPFHTKREKTFSPELNSRPGHSQLSCDVLVENALASHNNDSCAFNHAQGETSRAYPGIQDRTLFGRQNDRERFFHVA